MQLKDVHKTYYNKSSTVHALKGINVCIENKGVYVIVGPSGCGKTTLLHILSGSDKKFEGNYEIDGEVEIIEQELVLFESMSVLDNLLFVSNNIETIEQYLEQFQLLHLKKQKVVNLSIGEKKRVQIIRSLLMNPTYLLCDEPTAGLDHENAILIMETLKRISKNISVIIVTHKIAIMEYADYVIRMDNGEIIYEERVNPGGDLKHLEITKRNKTIKEHSMFLKKYLLSRKRETFLKMILIFVIILSGFSSSLFQSVENANSNKNKWENGDNLIITQPNADNEKYKNNSDSTDDEKEFSSVTLYDCYDIYEKKDIQLIRDNVKEVIGYRCGWNLEKFSNTDDWISPALNIEGARELIQKAEQEMRETGKTRYSNYEYLKKEVERIDARYPQDDFSRDIVIGWDYHYYSGFKSYSSEEKQGIYMPLTDWDFHIQNINISIKPYQIFDRFDVPLAYGQMMSDDNEVILAYNTAEIISKKLGLSSIEDLIGKEYEISIEESQEYNATNQLIYVPIQNIKISGILYEGNNNEYQAYFKEGVYDSIYENYYGMVSEYLQYQFIDFLIDEESDAQSVCEEINQLLDSKESHFMASSEVIKSLENREEYQNSSRFYMYMVIIFIALILLYAVLIGIHFTRNKKETKLLQTYGYKALIMRMYQNLVLFIITGIIEALMLPLLCQIINNFAHKLHYATVVSYQLLPYILSFVLAFLCSILVEGVNYGLQIRKS